MDDPTQPLGTDTAMLQRVLAAAAGAAAAPGGGGVVHTTGFTPTDRIFGNLPVVTENDILRAAQTS